MSKAAQALLKKHGIKKPLGLYIQIQEMEAYDMNPSMRFLLLVIAMGTRKPKEDYDNTWAPTGWTAEEMVGWCDMAQWRLAQRVGVGTDWCNKMLQRLEDEGFIEKEQWIDPDTQTPHCRYRVIVATVEANQRPVHSPNAKRGSRYAEGSRKTGKRNKGMFSTSNQPGNSDTRKAIKEQDDEN